MSSKSKKGTRFKKYKKLIHISKDKVRIKTRRRSRRRRRPRRRRRSRRRRGRERRRCCSTRKKVIQALQLSRAASRELKRGNIKDAFTLSVISQALIES